MDVLTDVLQRSRARGAAFAQTTGRGQWGVRFAAQSGLAVHSTLVGDVHLLVDGVDDGIRLLPGDVVLVQGTMAHRIVSAPHAPTITLDDLLARGPTPGNARSFLVGDPVSRDPDSVFFCGAYLFEGDLAAGLLDSLPPVVHLRPAPHETLHAALALLGREVAREEAGQQTLLDRLLDVVLVQSVRSHFAAQGDRAPGWFRASSDPDLAVAVRALHADPAHAWTVAELAELASMSRSAFARRFRHLVGVPPLAYLTDWRMALARERLRDTDDGLATIAASVGYGSEFAFASTFKRQVGFAPGQWRRSSRDAAVAAH
jgi:AraC-like DNA-binding protein